ncbi:Pentatricopeptide repeat-containing protein, partial [Cucurbita argyrosperma subsp. argyrosperma]
EQRKRQIHGGVINLGLGDHYVQNSRIRCYGACGDFSSADVVSWTIMIAGLGQSNHPKESLELFSKMRSLGSLGFGTWVHEYIDQRGIKWNIRIGTAIVDMYAKCWCIEMALQIFNNMPQRNIPSLGMPCYAVWHCMELCRKH